MIEPFLGTFVVQLVDTVSFLQANEHPSPLTVFPSSHSSPSSLFNFPSPHSSLQLEHPSPVALFPSSHCYVPLLLTIVSPQYSTAQSEVHPSPETRLPSPQV